MNKDRYSRQSLVIGEKAQRILSSKKVAIVGVGALGTVAAELLVRSGVRNIILIDRDVIEESNLQRQTLFLESDVDKSKALVAKERLQQINSSIKITAHAIHLNAGNITPLKEVDLILDCTDNLQARFLLNDFCKKQKIPWIYAAAIKTTGYVMPIIPQGPCLRCFIREVPLETCDTVGVLNTITTSIAALQVTIALKLLIGGQVAPTLQGIDIWNNTYKQIQVPKRKNCPTCNGKYEYLILKPESKLIKFCSDQCYQISGKPIDLKVVEQRWKNLGEVQRDEVSVRFDKIILFKDGRALIKAKNETEALSLYSKLVGN